MEENETLEFKKSISELKEAIISITAILNKHKKGELYIGLDNKGKTTKQTITEKTLRDISQAIANHIEPKIYPEIQQQDEYIKISFEGLEIPYFAYGRAYIRVADEDKKLSAKELENIILRKEQTKWDSKPSNIKLRDIDTESLKKYIQKANAEKRINFKFSDEKSILNKLHLLKEGKPINASKLLFSNKKPLELQAAVFAGTNKTTFLDIKQYKGNIFELLEISENYIKEHMNWKADLTGSKRIEIPEVPIRAIKEALVNSFCHRDFQAPESNKIAMYKDKIEIWNPGNFPEGYSPEDFIKKETPSVLRNPAVANILYLSADIEKWGSGLKRIYEECKKNNILVSFNVMKYGFSVVFKRPSIKKGVEKGVEHLSENERVLVELIYKNPKISKKELGVKLGEKLGVKLGENEAEILRILAENNNATSKQLSVIIGISTTAVENNIAKLKKKGILNRIGPDKGGYWEVLI